MGGHGGLNILPQKRWNVYNYENREKVRRDEEAAAKEEQIKREQARKREAEFRLERLRHARGLAPSSAAVSSIPEPEPESKPKSNHVNLFEGIKIFDPVSGAEGKGDDERRAFKRMKMAKEAAPRTVMPEDEKYRMGYGIAGKGVKLPWYLSRPSDDGNAARDVDEDDDDRAVVKEAAKSKGKKTLEELREERLTREKKEKERERALIMEKSRRDGTFSKDRRSFRR